GEARYTRETFSLPTTESRPLMPAHHPIDLLLRGDETLAGVLVSLHQRRDLVQCVLVLGLDLHAGDDELGAVRVDVTDERGRGIDAAAQGLRGIFRRHLRRGNKLAAGLVVDTF